MEKTQTVLLILAVILAYLVYNQNYITLGIVIAIFIALLSLIYFKQNNLLYMPVVPGLPKSPQQNPSAYRHPRNQRLDSIDLNLKTQDNITIRGWHLPQNQSSRIIVYFHENAGNIGTRIPFIKYLSERTNSDVVLVAYRGYSDSDGEPTQEGLKKDAKTVMQYAIDYGKNHNKKVFILGRSLGGAVASYISSLPEYQTQVSGLVLQNTFTSISEMIDAIFSVLKPFKFLQTNHWQTIKIIDQIKAPLLFIKSMQDQLVPPQHMDQLIQKAKQVKQVQVYEIKDGTHNSSWDIEPAIYFQRLTRFFENSNEKVQQSDKDSQERLIEQDL